MTTIGQQITEEPIQKKSRIERSAKLAQDRKNKKVPVVSTKREVPRKKRPTPPKSEPVKIVPVKANVRYIEGITPEANIGYLLLAA